jgi:hypothetical protein
VLLVGDDANDQTLHQKGAPFYNALHSDHRLMAASVSLNLNLIDFKEVTPKRILERNLGEITIRQGHPIAWLFQWDE